MAPLQEKALALALRAHAGQSDKNGEPYIMHVVRTAAEFAYDPILYSAVLCHKVIEGTFGTDNQITIEDVVNELGIDVAVMVDALTRHYVGMKYIEQINPTVTYAYTDKQEAFIEGIIEIIASQPPANLLSTEDVYDNLDPWRIGVLSEDELGRIRRYQRALSIVHHRGS
jgi:(p)ppGpp synthase/HD superfamily hydrolase